MRVYHEKRTTWGGKRKPWGGQKSSPRLLEKRITTELPRKSWRCKADVRGWEGARDRVQ